MGAGRARRSCASAHELRRSRLTHAEEADAQHAGRTSRRRLGRYSWSEYAAKHPRRRSPADAHRQGRRAASSSSTVHAVILEEHAAAVAQLDHIRGAHQRARSARPVAQDRTSMRVDEPDQLGQRPAPERRRVRPRDLDRRGGGQTRGRGIHAARRCTAAARRALRSERRGQGDQTRRAATSSRWGPINGSRRRCRRRRCPCDGVFRAVVRG